MSALQGALLVAEAPTSALMLRPYQDACLEAIAGATARGVRRQLVVLPTGAGKTVIFATAIARLLAAQGGRALILAHRDELIAQAVEKFRAVAGDTYTLGVVKAERSETDRQVLVGSVQTLARPQRIKAIPRRDILAVVIDEAHHAMATTYRQIIDHLGAGQVGGPLLLGFTATPDRGDKQLIGGHIFDEQVYTRTILDLIEAGYLVDVEARSVYLADADLSRVRSARGDLDQGELERVLLHANAPRRVVEAYTTYAAGKKALAFTPGVRLAYAMAAAFREAGIASEAVDGTTHPVLRRAVLERFGRGETRVLCNDSILTEGYDESSVECVIMARPTKSRPLYQQIIGRGLRLHPGKMKCLVLDLCGNAGKHDLATVPDVFGLSGDGEVASVKEAAKKEEERKKTVERERTRDAEHAAMVARTVDLFRSAQRGTFHWVAMEKDGRLLMVLPVGARSLVKVGEAQPGLWAVVLNQESARPRLLGSGLSQEAARQQAEWYAVRHGSYALHHAGLAWRGGPCSRSMRVWAQARGIVLPPGCTAGDASDAILLHQARHGFS